MSFEVAHYEDMNKVLQNHIKKTALVGNYLIEAYLRTRRRYENYAENAKGVKIIVRSSDLSGETSVSNRKVTDPKLTWSRVITFGVSRGCISCRVHSALIDVLDVASVVLQCGGFHV